MLHNLIFVKNITIYVWRAELFRAIIIYTKGKQNRFTKEKITMVNAGRTVIDFDMDWKFLKMSRADGRCDFPIESTGFDDNICENVNLPHTWNADDGADGHGG